MFCLGDKWRICYNFALYNIMGNVTFECFLNILKLVTFKNIGERANKILDNCVNNVFVTFCKH